MAAVTGRLTDYGNAHDFRSVLEDRLNAKRSELGETEQSLKKFVNNRLGSVTQGKADGPDRLPGFRGRLGPVVSARGGRGGGQPAGDRRSSIGSRLGPRISESLEDDDGSLIKGGSNGFGGEVTGRGSVMSRIVVEQKSREDALAEQKVDKKETQRNRRMFGSILGTLQKFRADENKVKDRELKKRQIEAKIDKKTEKEREEAIRQKKELFEDKRRKEREIKVLQVQMKRAEEFETWERSKRKEQKYIRTKNGSIQIYFLPKEHNDATFAALEDTMDEIDKEIQSAKELFEDELLKISQRAEQNPNANLDDLEGDDDNSGEEDDTDKTVTKSIVSTIKKPHPDKFTQKENKELVRKEEPLRTRSMQESDDISKTLDSIIDNNLNGHSSTNGDKAGEREKPEYPVITTRDRNVDITAGKCDQEPEKGIGEKLKNQANDIAEDVQTTVNETEKASTTAEIEKKVHTTTTNIKGESGKNTEEPVSAVTDNASSDKQVGSKLDSSNKHPGLHKSRSKSPKGGKAPRHRSISDERRKDSNRVHKEDGAEKSLTRKRKCSGTKSEQTKKTKTRSRKKESSGDSSSSSSSSSEDQSESEEKSSASNSSSEDSDSSDASSSSDSPDTKSRKKRSGKISAKSGKTSISKKRKKESSPSSTQNRRSRKSRTQASRRRKVSNKRGSDSSDSD